MKTIKKPIKYPGGKSYLADWIISLMPPHKRYVETHFGSGAVLFAKSPEGVSEIVNDIDSRLMSFWNVLRDKNKFAMFSMLVSVTPLSEEVFSSAKESLKGNTNYPPDDAVTAFEYYCVCRMSRQGNKTGYITPTSRTRRGMNENVSAFLSSVEGLPEVHERLRRVEIYNRDAVQLLKNCDREGTHFYLDPPYMHGTRVSKTIYTNEMSEEEHVELLEALAKFKKATFQLSGYESLLYLEHAAANGWRCEKIEIDNKMSQKKTKPKKTECLWMNYDPAAAGE